MTRLRALLLLTCIAASAIGLGIVLAVRNWQLATPAAFPSDHTVVAVHITRDPGLLVVPQVDQTITDRNVAGRLAGDIEALPPFPKGGMICPNEIGTTYDLTFSTVSGGSWSAVVSVLGCRGVNLSNGRILWAYNANMLFTDFGAALGLASDELIPHVCPPPTPDTRCYSQPTPSRP